MPKTPESEVLPLRVRLVLPEPGVLLAARQRAGLSQTDLGLQLRRPSQDISRWERGAAMTLQTAYMLAEALGLTPEVLTEAEHPLISLDVQAS